MRLTTWGLIRPIRISLHNAVGLSSYLRYEIFYVNPTNAATGSYTVTYAIVPEPSTWAMMLLGFAGLGFAGCQSERGAMRRLCAIAEKA